MTALRTYGSLEFLPAEKGALAHWRITEIAPHAAIQFKQLFPKVPKAAVPPYDFAATPSAAKELDWFRQKWPLRMEAPVARRLREARRSYDRQQAALGSVVASDWMPLAGAATRGLKPGQTLRRHQLREIEILKLRGSLLVGDIGGMGKTFAAAGAIATIPGATPAALVVETHMQEHWAEKLTAFTDLKPRMIETTKPFDLGGDDVFIFRISQVAGWVDYYRTHHFPFVGYDEPQFLRTGAGTAKGMACRVLSANATWRMGLSATPAYNYAGGELWNVLQFIDPMALGDADDFLREWCVLESNHWRVRDGDALHAHLKDVGVYVRHTPRDYTPEERATLPKVPRIRPEIFDVPYDENEVARMLEIARRLALKMREGSFVERGRTARELDIMARQSTGVAKAAGVADFVRSLHESGEPVVLWGWHREVYRIWNRRLADLNPVMYTGSESPRQKRENRRRFVAGESGPLIMSLRSGAGVDGLQERCRMGVFGELDWSPFVHRQCIWRLERERQKRPGSAFFCVTDEGSDPPMMELLGIKRSENEAVFGMADDGGDPDALVVESQEQYRSRIKLLAEHFLKKAAVSPGEIEEIAHLAAEQAPFRAVTEPA